MIEQDYQVRIKRYEPSDPRLGRHVRHDSRSLQFKAEAAPLSSLKSVRHQRHIPILDQGQLGSCTGNAGIGVLGSSVFYNIGTGKLRLSPTDSTVDEQIAVGVYSAATQLDSYTGTYPPTDTGSDGLSVAKVLLQRGYIAGYQHATSLESALTALSQKPVMVGTVWKSGMFIPRTDGKLMVSGSVEGGHEYVLDELDVENKRVWMANSWTDKWGIHGRAYLTWDELGELLDQDGDCTVFVPVNQPAPTPTPPAPPQPTPPTPDPAEELIGKVRVLTSTYLANLKQLLDSTNG